MVLGGHWQGAEHSQGALWVQAKGTAFLQLRVLGLSTAITWARAWQCLNNAH